MFKICVVMHAKMSSSCFVRNIIVMCAYLSNYQSMDVYRVYCEIGITIAIALIQLIIDDQRIDHNEANISSIHSFG